MCCCHRDVLRMARLDSIDVALFALYGRLFGRNFGMPLCPRDSDTDVLGLSSSLLTPDAGRGMECIPSQGGAIITPNHVSYADAILIEMGCGWSGRSLDSVEDFRFTWLI